MAAGSPGLTNSAWVDIQNTTTSTAGLSVEIGRPASRPVLFAYASKSAPLTDCVVFGTGRKLFGSNSLVVPPSKSAWVLVDAGNETGVLERP
jgi:hypothetical protein